MMRWIEEIVVAFKALGGAARYKDLYTFIEENTNRSLTQRWKATVRRTIEDHSSDSLNHRSDDLFRKVGHGHWALRNIEISDEELKERSNLSTDQILKRVFVREHYRNHPGNEESFENEVLELAAAKLEPINAWCTNSNLEVELISQVIVRVPLWWFPRLLNANQMQRSNVEYSQFGIHWPDVNEDISIISLLRGEKAPDAVSPKGGQA